jgi:hypothetical protein
VVHRVASANRCRKRQVFYATRNSLWLIRTYYTWPGKAYLLVSRAVARAAVCRTRCLSAWSPGGLQRTRETATSTRPTA